MLRCKDLANGDLDPDNPWSDLLSSVAWAIISTHHTTIGATPGQMIFRRDMVHPLVHVVDWDLVKKRKAKMLLQSNASENKKRLKYSYQKGQKVLIVNKDIKRKLSCKPLDLLLNRE